MPYDLASFSLVAMTQLGATLRRIGPGASSAEEVAHRVVRLLYDGLIDSATVAITGLIGLKGDSSQVVVNPWS